MASIVVILFVHVCPGLFSIIIYPEIAFGGSLDERDWLGVDMMLEVIYDIGVCSAAILQPPHLLVEQESRFLHDFFHITANSTILKYRWRILRFVEVIACIGYLPDFIRRRLSEASIRLIARATCHCGST